MTDKKEERCAKKKLRQTKIEPDEESSEKVKAGVITGGLTHMYPVKSLSRS